MHAKHSRDMHADAFTLAGSSLLPKKLSAEEPMDTRRRVHFWDPMNHAEPSSSARDGNPYALCKPMTRSDMMREFILDEQAEQEMFQKGVEKGLAVGFEKGFDKGFDKGHQKGHQKGYQKAAFESFKRSEKGVGRGLERGLGKGRGVIC